MSESPLISVIIRRLSAAGYSPIGTPFSVATVKFDFTSALRGRDGRSLDLVLLIDTTTGEFGDRDAVKVRQRVEALSRALDVTQSRYVLTVILAGAVLTGEFEILGDVCRVLNIDGITLNESGDPANDTAKLSLDDALRVLLPLQLPGAVNGDIVRKGPVDALLQAVRDSVEPDLAAKLIAASEAGEEAVAKAISEALEDALKIETVA